MSFRVRGSEAPRRAEVEALLWALHAKEQAG